MKYELKNGWTKDIDKDIVFKFAEGYKDFLTTCKTERECVAETIRLAEDCGFKPLDSFDTLKEGDKVYVVNKLRSVLLAVIGLFASVVSQLGDLSASLIKRHWGIKDYGKLFPGHGGILDRFDSILSVSVFLYLVSLIGGNF